MKLIVGLGNIGLAYDKTYHNIGFKVLDYFAAKNNISIVKKSSVGFYSEDTLSLGQKTEKIICLKPNTYMNLSGNSVLAFMRKYKIPPENILIIFDDIDLKLGTLRFRKNGSGGTHNGMRDIAAKCGSDMPRLKIGIDNEKERNSLASFVLSKIDEESLQVFNKVFEEANKKILEFVFGT